MFIHLTRIYKKTNANGAEEIVQQPLMLALDSIESIRPRKKLRGNRATVITKGGRYYNVAETRGAIEELIQNA